MSGLDNFIEDELGGTMGSDEVAVDCLSCGKENHMYINTTTGLAYCFVCGYAANLVKLIMDLKGVPRWTATEESAKLLRGLQRHRRNSDTQGEMTLLNRILGYLWGKKDLQHETVVLPTHTVPISHPKAAPAQAYLEARGMTREHYLPYRLKYVLNSTDDFKFRNHILFPDFNEDGDLDYFTTRYAGDPGEYPKSYHPKGANKTRTFGAWNCNRKRGVFLVEGPLDMLALGGCAVALLGKKETVRQQMFIAKNYKAVTVALDDEAMDEAMGLMHRLAALGIDVTYVLPHGDPADEVMRTPMALVVKYLKLRARSRLADRMRATLKQG